MRLPMVMQGVSKELYNDIRNVTVWRALRKRLHLKAYKLSIVHRLEPRLPSRLHGVVLNKLRLGTDLSKRIKSLALRDRWDKSHTRGHDRWVASVKLISFSILITYMAVRNPEGQRSLSWESKSMSKALYKSSTFFGVRGRNTSKEIYTSMYWGGKEMAFWVGSCQSWELGPDWLGLHSQPHPTKGRGGVLWGGTGGRCSRKVRLRGVTHQRPNRSK
jgi:hypothetical protein